jgi:drug/metabolite transporter (DMT)-like permease
MTQHHLGLILVLLSTLAWSTSGLFTRALTLDLMTVLTWRSIFAGLGFLAVLLAMQGWQGLRGFARMGRIGWLYAAISATGIFTFIASLTLTTIAHVAIIYATVPFITALLAWAVLGTRPTASALGASALAFAGAVGMVGFSNEGTLLGDFLALGTAVVMGLLTVIARRNPDMPALPSGAASVALALLICLPMASPGLPPPDQLWVLAGFGLINSTLGFTLFILGSRRITPIETSLIGALEAPITPFWVWLVFSETPTAATLLGGGVVFAAVFWHIWRSNRTV